MSATERARRIDAGEPYALRLDMAAAIARVGPLTWSETGAGPNGETGTIAANPAAWGDVILARKDTPTSYHLAVVVDDAAQGVTDVVRGRDLFHATSVHRLLQALLGLPQPRLSPPSADPAMPTATSCRNRRCATALRELRARGATPGRHPPAGRARLSAGFRAIVPAGVRDRWRSAGLRKSRATAARRLRTARKQSRAAPSTRAVEAALAGVAHDIRTPLTGIVALAELLALPISARASANGRTRSRAAPIISPRSPR